MRNKIGYYAFLTLIGLMKITPFWVIYRISDMTYFLMYRVIGYRKAVINKNLDKCFPEKSQEEKLIIRKKFYRNLSDLLIESFKGYSLSAEQMLMRFKAFNEQVADKYFEQGKDVIVLAGHFANWEWGAAATAKSFKHQPAVLYKPLSNPYIDRFVREKRARFGVDLVPINQTARYFIKKKEKPVAYYMVADQYPTNKSKQKYADFFGSKTAFLHGPENYAKQLGIPVVYIEMKRIKRGYYSMEMMDVTDKPKELEDNELTQIYAHLMEQSIVNQPEDWMWSHKRWKGELYSFTKPAQ